MRKAARLGLCAAALLASAGSATGVAQTLAGPWGCPRPQLEGSAFGNPEHGKHVAAEKCAACHGADGNSPAPQFPKLAGQNPAYALDQLWAFKRGTRRSDVMPGIVATLSDADMADVASFYSREARKPGSANDRRLAAVGERLFFSGMPSCAMCHGAGGRSGMPMMGMMGHGMMGMMGSSVPNLNGQHAAYIIGELNRFASGERRGTIMNRIAAGLSEMNKRALSEFLSSAP
jgi:cytochrome c553